MTKDELKAYISEAVDAMDSNDLETLFPPANQPDLYAVVAELTGLKGAFGKLSGSTLKLNHEIHSLVEQVGLQQEQQAHFIETLTTEKEELEADKPLDSNLKTVLLQLLDMDELIQLTESSYQDLPQLGWMNQATYKTRLASWQKGFDITLERWKKLLKSTNLYKTGSVGEIFNPELHEAVAVKHINNLTDNSILETEQTGFLHKGQVIRLAKVVVNKVQVVKEIIPIPIETEETSVKEELLKDIQQLETEIHQIGEVIKKQKPRPKRKKGAGGRRKKRKRKRK